eukprot:Awhi_evm1s5009
MPRNSSVSAKNVAVIGTGYVGLPLCVLLRRSNHNVLGYDASAQKIASLNNGISYIGDVENHELRGISFTADPKDIKASDVHIICVPTPVGEDFNPDLTILRSVVKTLETYARSGCLIICESTVGVGDTDALFTNLVNKGCRVCHSPERIDPGRKYPNYKDIPKVIGGMDEISTHRGVQFYQTVFKTVVAVRSAKHSEAVKLLENSFRAINISFINEFSNYCDNADLNVNEIIDAASTKPYGFMEFRPWVGVGGHCIPVDPHYLIKSQPIMEWPLLSEAMTEMHSRPSNLANVELKKKESKLNKVLVCGVSYKPDIADVRDAPQKEFIETMLENNVDVHFYDPIVESYMGLTKQNSLDNAHTYDKVYVMHQHSNHDYSSLDNLSNVQSFVSKRKLHEKFNKLDNKPKSKPSLEDQIKSLSHTNSNEINKQVFAMNPTLFDLQRRDSSHVLSSFSFDLESF